MRGEIVTSGCIHWALFDERGEMNLLSIPSLGRSAESPWYSITRVSLSCVSVNARGKGSMSNSPYARTTMELNLEDADGTFPAPRLEKLSNPADDYERSLTLPSFCREKRISLRLDPVTQKNPQQYPGSGDMGHIGRRLSAANVCEKISRAHRSSTEINDELKEKTSESKIDALQQIV